MSLAGLKERLSVALEDHSQDGQLLIMLQDATDFFCAYCRRMSVPARAEGLIERLAVWQREHRIGVTSESIGDTSVSFDVSDLPMELQRELNRYRRIGAG
ncbi:MAG: phage head-tail connector protein [Paenibacillus dendritiformis]|uniref:phage head-tail connector protein n=1 Tax=uncultured Paenibacillus sp. TaxID=227322 RepID=UPI0025E7A934|nr:phage head-tail connector protein [uncultured Paenibacillus sp.]MDU5141069.1 phage head-tail connector protein [Paenibacillus dendritiformis]